MLKINLAHDAKRAFHNHRGLGNYSRDVIRIIDRYLPDYNQTLLNPKLNGSIDFNAASNCTVVSPKGWFYNTLPALWRSYGCVKELEKHNIQIFHGLAQELPIGIEKTNIRTILTVHDAIFLRNPELYPKDYVYIFTRKNRRACKVADKILAISQQTKSDFIEFLNVPEDKIEVVYQGCNNKFREDISNEEKERVRLKYNLPEEFILNVGAIEPRKNILLAIKAIHLGKIDYPIVIVGQKTKYLQTLTNYIVTNNMQNRVIFIHDATNADIPALYALSKAFVYPSIFEGFGIPILEALCTKTPVITSTGSCFAETGGPSSIYVNPSNTDEMIDALNRVLTDSTLRDKMIQDGTKFASNFTDEKIANRLDSLYKSML